MGFFCHTWSQEGIPLHLRLSVELEREKSGLPSLVCGWAHWHESPTILPHTLCQGTLLYGLVGLFRVVRPSQVGALGEQVDSWLVCVWGVSCDGVSLDNHCEGSWGGAVSPFLAGVGLHLP